MTKKRPSKKNPLALDRAVVLGTVLVTMLGAQLLADQDFMANSSGMVVASQQMTTEERRQAISQPVNVRRPVTRTQSSR